VDLRTNSGNFPEYINGFVPITEIKCVYCAVRAGSSNGISVNLSLIGGWLFASLCLQKTGFDPRQVQVRFIVDKMALGRVFFRSTPVFSCQYHSTNAPYSSSSTCFSYHDKYAKAGTRPKSKWFSSNPGALYRKSTFLSEVIKLATVQSTVAHVVPVCALYLHTASIHRKWVY
jgi:hypothetical protein